MVFLFETVQLSPSSRSVVVMASNEMKNSENGGQPVSPIDSLQIGDTEQAHYTEKGVATNDVDEALKFLGTGERVVFTDEQNKKLLRKIGVFQRWIPHHDSEPNIH